MAQTQQHSRQEVAPLIRDVIPEHEPPKVAEAVTKALALASTIVMAPRFMTEKDGRGVHPMDAVMQRAIGGRDKCQAPIVPMIKHSRFRPGDLVVVCVPDPNATHSYKHAKLAGPLSISEHWDATAEGGAGAVNTNTFFAALAKLAAPLYCARREDNGTFELRFA